jgi:hypothetical protein
MKVKARRAGEKERARARAEPAARALWAKAEELSAQPWKLVAERLNVNEAVAVDAYRHHRLPPGVSAEAAAAFA